MGIYDGDKSLTTSRDLTGRMVKIGMTLPKWQNFFFSISE